MFIDNLITSISQEINNFYGNYWLVAILTLFLGISTYTDIKSLKIPNKLNLLFGIIAIAVMPFLDFTTSDVLLKIAGAVFGFMALLIPAVIKTHPMGGDIKCVTVVGLFLGIWLVPPFLALACLYGVIYLILRFKTGKVIGNMPFAPFFFVSNLTLFIFAFFI